MIEAADGAEILEDDEPERPADCQCSPLFDDLLCWPCYRDGFREPAPTVDGEFDSEDD